MRIQQQKKNCDICIIGAGPAGLAALSAIHEPYTLDSMTPRQFESANLSMKRNSHKSKKDTSRGKVGPSDKKICVVDSNCDWLGSWRDNFSRLGIKYLRSPAIAHSDHFDATALLAYAVANDREDELIESGCAEIRKLHGLGQTQVGLWKLPSTSLFEDFNADLANKLDHEYVQGTAVDIDITCHDNNDSINEDCKEGYTLTLADGTEITCKAVVLALGPTGKPVIPSKICKVPNDQLIPWNQMNERLMSKHEVVLVVGGGLTAVQAAQYSLRQGKRVYLCSRRPLVERHFDIAECWFDKRSANKHISDFYHLHQDERLAALRDVRGGGSVPPLYMNDIRKWERSGQLTIVNNVEPRYVSSTDVSGKVLISLDQLGDCEEDKQRKKKNVQVEVDCVILACGLEPDCLKNKLVRKIHEKFPIDIVGGLPNISVDLEWTKNLFVVGALASLNVGPDGGNIMGARRAASIVANSLECKSWLRQEEGGALSNPFEAFWDESSSDEESEVE